METHATSDVPKMPVPSLIALAQPERRLLSLVLEGLCDKDIAQRLDIPLTALKGRKRKLCLHLNVRTSAQLLRAVYVSLIDPKILSEMEEWLRS